MVIGKSLAVSGVALSLTVCGQGEFGQQCILGSRKVVSFAGGLCSHEILAGAPMGIPL